MNRLDANPKFCPQRPPLNPFSRKLLAGHCPTSSVCYLSPSDQSTKPVSWHPEYQKISLCRPTDPPGILKNVLGDLQPTYKIRASICHFTRGHGFTYPWPQGSRVKSLGAEGSRGSRRTDPPVRCARELTPIIFIHNYYRNSQGLAIIGKWRDAISRPSVGRPAGPKRGLRRRSGKL